MPVDLDSSNTRMNFYSIISPLIKYKLITLSFKLDLWPLTSPSSVRFLIGDKEKTVIIGPTNREYTRKYNWIESRSYSDEEYLSDVLSQMHSSVLCNETQIKNINLTFSNEYLCILLEFGKSAIDNLLWWVEKVNIYVYIVEECLIVGRGWLWYFTCSYYPHIYPYVYMYDNSFNTVNYLR